eukprot:364893-Amphidinium_carterae.1
MDLKLRLQKAALPSEPTIQRAPPSLPGRHEYDRGMSVQILIWASCSHCLPTLEASRLDRHSRLSRLQARAATRSRGPCAARTSTCLAMMQAALPGLQRRQIPTSKECIPIRNSRSPTQNSRHCGSCRGDWVMQVGKRVLLVLTDGRFVSRLGSLSLGICCLRKWLHKP